MNQWSKLDETYSQLWEVEYAGNGGYYINPINNTLLNMTALSNASGNNYEVKLSSGLTSKWAIVEYGSGLYNVVPLDYPDKALSVNSTGTDNGINIVAQNRVQGSSTQKWLFESFEIKRAVILIHGRIDNSEGCFGAINAIGTGKNNEYDPSINAKTDENDLYTSYEAQKNNLCH